MTRRRAQLQYSPRHRRTRLAGTRYGPAAALALIALLLAATPLMLRGLLPLLVRTDAPAPPYAQSAPAQEDFAPPANGEAGEAATDGMAGTVALTDVADVQVLADPFVDGDAILFAAGMEAGRFDRLVRFDTVTGEAEGVLVPMRFDTLRNPVEDDARIVYVDAKTGGGGAVRAFDKAAGEAVLVCELANDVPVLYYESPYLVFTERTLDGAVKLYACHLGTSDAVTLAVFSSEPAALSQPWLVAGEALYAVADPADEEKSLLRAVHLSDGDVDDYAPGMRAYQPRRQGGALAWMRGGRGADNELYCAIDGGRPMLIETGVVDFGMADNVLAYGLDGTVLIYAWATGDARAASGENERAQFAAAGGNCVVWRVMNDPENPVWKYMRVD